MPARTLALLLALLLCPTTVTAQWSWRGDVEVGARHDQNIFKSPRLLRHGDLVLGADSLYQSDLVVPLRVDVEFDHERGAHAFEVSASSQFDRYAEYAHLNGGRHQATLQYGRAVGNGFEVTAEVAGRRSRSVSTNVMGEELTRLFAYRQSAFELDVEWEPHRRHDVSVEIDLYRRDYDETEGFASIDHGSRRATLEWAYTHRRRVGKRWRSVWELGAEIFYRQKRYATFHARDRNGRQHETYPQMMLHYAGGEAWYGRPLGRRLHVDIEASASVRTDPFEGYYSYHAAGADIELEWEPGTHSEVSVEAGWRHLRYAVKDAPQADGPAEPGLVYDYLDWKLAGERTVRRGIAVELFAESDRRASNVTLETFRTRRPYATMRLGVRLRAELDHLVR